MAKLIGNIRITAKPGGEGVRPHFDVIFVPYAGRLNTQTVTVDTYDDLVAFLTGIRISEDEATRWAGKSRSEGVVLIPSVERTEDQLRESGLLA
jgi:hypothetical protein